MTAGESHGPSLTAIIEGIPAGLKLDLEEINRELARRQQGYGRGGRMKIETDRAEFLSGVRFGETIGSPITVRVVNRDWENWTERMSAFGAPARDRVTEARPGHADYVGVCKYDRSDIRDILERASARETAMRVAVGAICRQLLREAGITLTSQVINIGGEAINRDKIDELRMQSRASELNCYDEEAEERMKEKIKDARAQGDTLGGIFEIIVKGAPIGLGSHIQWDRRLDAALAGAMMSIQAIKGVEIGAGFSYAELPGSKAHDEMFYENGKIFRKTNNAGGLEGGMTNGENIIIRAVMKPIPTLMKPLQTVDIKTKEAVLASKERSDVCAVSAASVVGEAMTAFVMARALTEKFGGDALCDLKRSMEIYNERISLE